MQISIHPQASSHDAAESRFWDDEAADYSRYVLDELNGPRAQAWLSLVESHFAGKKGLDILDAGTGPGFFPCILAAAGHKVTGIDSSVAMLQRARANVAKRGLQDCVRLETADCVNLPFPTGSFDVVVSRNVTWALRDPRRAYAEWQRVLRPGGLLLVYDANWHLQFYNKDVERRVRENEESCADLYGVDMRVCRDDKPYYDSLPLSNTLRPSWDSFVLADLGMVEVTARENVGDAVYEDWEKVLYAESPLFEISARKATVQEARTSIESYWQDRAASFGMAHSGQGAWGDLVQLALPPTCGPASAGDSFAYAADREDRAQAHAQRILDVGTGPGAVALEMAARGHIVTGVDLSANMVEHARENARTAGLTVTFATADAADLPFAPESFDVVVSRDVMWNMTDPEGALTSWVSVLRPGGRIIYFDADWHGYLLNEAADRLRRAFYTDGGNPRFYEMERVARTLPLTEAPRPAWDVDCLERLGCEVLAAVDVSDIVRDPVSRLKYSYAPEYMIVAEKRR